MTRIGSISGQRWRLETLIIRESDDLAENLDRIRHTDGAVFIDIHHQSWLDTREGSEIVLQPNDVPKR